MNQNHRLREPGYKPALWEWCNLMCSVGSETATAYVFDSEDALDAFARGDMRSTDITLTICSDQKLAVWANDRTCDLRVQSVYALGENKFAVYVEEEEDSNHDN